MIFIVSIILMFCFALSAVFIGFAPNVYKITDKDFVSRAIQNTEFEAMQYGDIKLRAGVLDTNATSSTSNNTIHVSPFTYVVNATDITINSVNITSSITVAIGSNDVENITVSAEKE